MGSASSMPATQTCAAIACNRSNSYTKCSGKLCKMWIAQWYLARITAVTKAGGNGQLFAAVVVISTVANAFFLQEGFALALYVFAFVCCVPGMLATVSIVPAAIIK